MAIVRVDKGIPMPAPGRFVNEGKYPWATLEIDDSFVHSSRVWRTE